jgi:hypothetical protein
MKLMFTGIFVAASAAPASLFMGGFALRHMLGGIPNAFQVASNTAAILLGLAFFIFMSGLAMRSKPKAVTEIGQVQS